MTGARFGELARLTVRDFDRMNGTVFVEKSKNGRARHIPLNCPTSAPVGQIEGLHERRMAGSS
jgi:site-specific recombinase XerD